MLKKSTLQVEIEVVPEKERTESPNNAYGVSISAWDGAWK